jgi:hypothetical protein
VSANGAAVNGNNGSGGLQPFRILSIDGGGILGAFVAGFLAGIEEQLGRPLADHFDLIAGTSTGGIIAAALAFREPASRIEGFYRERGPLIFCRRNVALSTRWKRCARWLGRRPADWMLGRLAPGIDSDYLLKSKYDGKVLRHALAEVFGSRPLGDSKSRLLIPSIDLTNGQTKVFKTRHLPHLHIDYRIPVVDVLMATTAAPTFFPHAQVQDGSAFVDGGLWANNPTMVGIVESMAIRDHCTRGCDPVFDLKTTSAFSIGTGRLQQFHKPPADGAGGLWWTMDGRLVRTTMMAQAQGAHFQAEYLLRDRLRRVDFDLPDNTWGLDSVDLCPEMIHRGRQQAAKEFGTLRHSYFDRLAPEFIPYTESDASALIPTRC